MTADAPPVASARPRRAICLVSHNAYGAISGRAGGFIGGVEWQTSFLARWLAARGHEVTMITWGEPAGGEEFFHGVRVIKVCGKEAGLPKIKFFHPRWTGLRRALAQAKADVYYHNCGEAVTGQISQWCRQQGRAFVFSVASDADCDPRLPELGTGLERALYRSGLRHADQRIVQTRRQERRLTEQFQLSSVIIPLPCPAPSPGAGENSDARPANRILWVGRMCQVKRPDRLLDLAEALPEFEFDFVGPFHDEPWSQGINQRARRLPNVQVHGPVPRERLHDFYERATLLCCTSDYEGFPNTFLEAWSHAVPVVATVNPDGLLDGRGLGVAVDDFAEMKNVIRRLSADPALRAQLGGTGRQYFLANHVADAVMPRFESVLLETAARGGRRG